METQLSIKHALNNFYQINNFGEEGGINQTWAWFKFGPVALPFYNFKQRREKVWMHDLNHLVTGYNTQWRGEVSVSAWEAATGGWGFSPVWILILSAFGIGIFIYPADTFRAFVRGRYTKGHVGLKLPKKQLIEQDLSALKHKLGLVNEPPHKANLSDIVAFTNYGIVSLALILFPVWAGFLAWYFWQ